MNMITINKLCPGQSADISALKCDGALQRRLMEMGMTEGTKVCCLYHGLRGSPIAFGMRGTVIALRADDAAKINGMKD